MQTRQENAGSALIIALWVIGILSLLITSFAFDMRVQAKITSFYKKRLSAEFLATSGIVRGEWMLTRSTDVSDTAEDEHGDAWWYTYAERIAKGGSVSFSQELDDGTFTVEITPEPALRNVNMLDEEDWKRLLEIGGVPEEDWVELIASVSDWIDADDNTRVYGAESEYYESQDESYKAKNGPLDTVDELLLVQGFTRGILYGSPADEETGQPAMLGIRGLLTVYGDANTVNVNAAGSSVLMTLPGMTELAEGDLRAERDGAYLDDPSSEDTSFKSVADVYARVPDMPPESKAKVAVVSKIFRMTSVGEKSGVSRRKSCVAVVDKYSMRVLRWVDQDVL